MASTHCASSKSPIQTVPVPTVSASWPSSCSRSLQVIPQLRRRRHRPRHRRRLLPHSTLVLSPSSPCPCPSRLASFYVHGSTTATARIARGVSPGKPARASSFEPVSGARRANCSTDTVRGSPELRTRRERQGQFGRIRIGAYSRGQLTGEEGPNLVFRSTSVGLK